MEELGQLALIALGSNAYSTWGNPTETVQKAMKLLQPLAISPVRPSRFYQTPAFPAGTGPDFVNLACAFFTPIPSTDLLAGLHRIEAQAGRTRDHRWGQRTLDLDLIGLGQNVLPDAAVHAYWRDLPLAAQARIAPETLILPHPRVQDRAFVLVPLADIAPDWRHPLLDLSVTEMLTAVPAADRACVVPFS